MKKRPLSIVIISLIYLFEPAGNLLQASYINKLPLWGENSIFHHLIWSDWIILALFPVVAVGIYRVRKWGWYLFVVFSALLVGYNLFVYLYLNQNYQLHTVLGFILFVTVLSAVFFRKHVYAPYFNPRLRWWEVGSRYRITLNVRILSNDAAVLCQMLDVSSSGCFVNHPEELPLGENVWLIIQTADTEINCLGKVVRRSEEPHCLGYGIFFQAVSRDTRRKIKRLIRTLEAHGGKDREGSISNVQIPKDKFQPKHRIFEHMELNIKPACPHPLTEDSR